MKKGGKEVKREMEGKIKRKCKQEERGRKKKKMLLYSG